MSCNSSIVFIRMSFNGDLTPEQIVEIMEKVEPTLSVDWWKGEVEHMSVDEAEATFRPIKIDNKYYIDRIIEYNYEENGDFSISLNETDIDGYIEEICNIDGVDDLSSWQLKAHVWYNGCEEPD